MAVLAQYKKSLESARDVLLFLLHRSASRVRKDDARRVRGLGAAVLEFASQAALCSRSLVRLLETGTVKALSLTQSE